MKSLKVIVTFCALGVSASAQLSLNSSNAEKQVAAFEAKNNAFINSRNLFASGQFAVALATLEAGNLNAAGTAEGYLETAGSLVQIALGFHQVGSTATAGTVLQVALQQFAKAEAGFSVATPTGEIANEKELVGNAYQFLLGDRVTAKQYYQAAVALSPKTGQAARYLAQIEQAEAEEARKGAENGH